MTLFSRLPANYVKGVAAGAIWTAIIAALFGTAALANYFEVNESSGMLWWKETREIPLEERRPSLIVGALLLTFAMVLLLVAAAAARNLWRTRDERHSAAEAAEQRRLAEQRRQDEREEHEAWLLTYEGDAWAARRRGDREYVVTLRVQPPEHRETIRGIEGMGWVLRGRDEHAAVRVKESRRNLDGGHTVVTTTTKDATFYFDRA